MLYINWKCYVLPILAFLLFLILRCNYINSRMKYYIPNEFYLILCQATILFIILFITCRIMDIFFDGSCHNYCEFDIKKNFNG